jgi:ectoine hydroxylase-related dioxygenase (phytanoyl-CoA dioxygenase family)
MDGNLFDCEQFKQNFSSNGYAIVEDVLSPEEISTLKPALEEAIEREVDYHQGPDYKDYGMVMLCSLYDKALVDLFDNPRLTEPFNLILGEECIIYAYTSSSMPPNTSNYSRRIHVDCPRIIPNFITNMGATILLDDFTEENGPTQFLPNSYLMAEEPSEEYFNEHAETLIAKAGTVWFFHARTWHRGGMNLTDKWRHALTLNVCRSWMKQRIDIPRAMSHIHMSGVSEQVKQKLGFLAQPPASYKEYYVPPDQRTFRQKTE